MVRLLQPQVLEARAGAPPKAIWREASRSWGGTNTAPEVLKLKDGSLLVIYEARDRSSKNLTTVVRAATLVHK